MARKGQFKKGGGRVGDGRSRRRRRRSSPSTKAITVRERITIAGPRRRSHGRGRRRHGSGGVKLGHLALATLGLAFVTSPQNNAVSKKVNEVIGKVPGSKTFGTTAIAGLGALAASKWGPGKLKGNKWLKALGYAGIVLTAAQVGNQGTDFKWLGDEEGFDLEDIDDIGDEDDDDDIEA